MTERVITKATITQTDFFGFPGANRVTVTLSDGTEDYHLFDYYADEISFTEAELVGMTTRGAVQLMNLRDLAYLRS